MSVAQWAATRLIRRVYHSYQLTLVSNPIAAYRVSKLEIQNVLSGRFLGVDCAPFDDAHRDSFFFQNQYGWDDADDRVVLVWLGRLTPDKGWGFALRAIEEWTKLHPDCINRVAIIVAGDGELRTQIHDILCTLGFVVAAPGRVPPMDIPAILANSDIHVTTSEKKRWA